MCSFLRVLKDLFVSPKCFWLQLPHGTQYTAPWKRRFIESFFINSTPNVINEKSADIFPTNIQSDVWPQMIQYHIAYFCFASVCSLFFIAVILLHNLLYSLLSTLRFNVVITTSCSHARSMNFYALLFLLPWCKPTVSWLKRRCCFLILQQLSKDFYCCYPVDWLCNVGRWSLSGEACYTMQWATVRPFATLLL